MLWFSSNAFFEVVVLGIGGAFFIINEMFDCIHSAKSKNWITKALKKKTIDEDINSEITY